MIKNSYKIFIYKTFILLLLIFVFSACKSKNEEKYFLFEEEIITIYVGDTYEIKYNTNVSSIKFYSDESDIIKIEGNIITGLSKGYATVYAQVDNVTYEMTVCVDKKKFVPTYHSLFIDGDEVKVREGTLIKTNLKEYYNGNMHAYYDDKTFEAWYLDENYTKLANLDLEIYEDIKLYAKYKEIDVVSEERIEVDNVIKYNTSFKSDVGIQTFSPSYGTYANSNVNDYSDYTFIMVDYDVDKLDYYVKEIIEEGAKQDVVIPVNGFIICIKKNIENYENLIKKLCINALISTSKYSINSSNIIYINEKYEKENIAIQPINVDCKYYSVYDVRSKNMIYSYQGDMKAYPASVTKVMTAITALTYANLEDTIVVGDELDITYEGSSPSTAGIVKGDIWSLRQLLYALLLPSGNDAGYEIAALTINKIYPNNSYTSHEKISMFSDLMNGICKRIGADNSHFMTPDGNSYYTSTGAWDERITNHYVTANDMVKIANYAFTFGAICEVVKTTSISFKTVNGKTYSFNNTNSFLKSSSSYYFEFCVGLKTGTTTPAGYCLVSAAEINRKFIIVVTLNNSTSAGRYTNSKYLYDLVYN